MIDDSPENRSYKRIIQSITVECVNFSASTDSFYRTKDISGGGVLLEMDKEFPLFSTLYLNIWLPKRKEPISALAQVVRVESIASNLYEIGLQFTAIEDTDRREILYLIEKN